MTAIMTAPRIRLRARQLTRRGRAPGLASSARSALGGSLGSGDSATVRSRSTDVTGGCSQPYPRIKECVDHVGEQIDQNDQRCEDKSSRLNEGVVAGTNGVDKQFACSRQTENVLHDDGTTQKITNRQSKQSQGRDERVAEDMRADDGLLP